MPYIRIHIISRNIGLLISLHQYKNSVSYYWVYIALYLSALTIRWYNVWTMSTSVLCICVLFIYNKVPSTFITDLSRTTVMSTTFTPTTYKLVANFGEKWLPFRWINTITLHPIGTLVKRSHKVPIRNGCFPYVRVFISVNTDWSAVVYVSMRHGTLSAAWRFIMKFVSVVSSGATCLHLATFWSTSSETNSFLNFGWLSYINMEAIYLIKCAIIGIEEEQKGTL